MKRFVFAICFLMFLGHMTANADATPNQDIKNTTEFEGSCSKATLMGEDVTSGCYGWAFRVVHKDGTSDFTFHIGQTVVMHFFGAPNPHPEANVDSTQVTKINAYRDSKLVGELPATGMCTVTGDISVSAIVDCEAVSSDSNATDHSSMNAVVKSIQPASFHDSFPEVPKPEGISVRYWDNFSSVCTKALIDGKDQTGSCKGVSHVGFGTDRVDFIMGVDGHMVAFSGDQERGVGTGHYVLYVNRLYHDKDFIPAAGKCELDGNADGKSTVVCDANSVMTDFQHTAHVEFAVSVIDHKDSGNKAP